MGLLKDGNGADLYMIDTYILLWIVRCVSSFYDSDTAIFCGCVFGSLKLLDNIVTGHLKACLPDDWWYSSDQNQTMPAGYNVTLVPQSNDVCDERCLTWLVLCS